VSGREAAQNPPAQAPRDKQPPLPQPPLPGQQHRAGAARWGRRRGNGSRYGGDEPQADRLSGWFSIYCRAHSTRGHLGTRLWPPAASPRRGSCCDPLPAAGIRHRPVHTGGPQRLETRKAWIYTRGLVFQRPLCGTELRGRFGPAGQGAIGNVKPTNRAPSYGSGRSLRRKRRRGVTSPSCQAPTFPETPRPGKQRFRAAARGRQPRGDLPAPYLTAPRCRPRGKHRSETGSGTGNNRSVLCTEDSGQPQPRKPRNPPPEGCI